MRRSVISAWFVSWKSFLEIVVVDKLSADSQRKWKSWLVTFFLVVLNLHSKGEISTKGQMLPLEPSKASIELFVRSRCEQCNVLLLAWHRHYSKALSPWEVAKEV